MLIKKWKKADASFNQTFIAKQIKFNHITKPTISNGENHIKAVNSENNITKNFYNERY